MYGRALAIYYRVLGVDSKFSAGVYHNIAVEKLNSCDSAGALESARESVRIYAKLGITDSSSQKAADLLKRLEIMQ